MSANKQAAAISSAIKLIRPEGIQQLSSIDSKGKIISKSFELPGELNDAAQWAVEQNHEKRNVYFTVNPLKHKKSIRNSDNDIAKVEYLYGDIDPDTSEGYEAGRKALLEGTVPQLFANGHSPNVLIDSGNGLQPLWRLDPPLEPQQFTTAKDVLKGVVDSLGADPSAKDLGRLLRLPGTWNYPNAKKLEKGYSEQPVAARLLDREAWASKPYSIADFTWAKPAAVESSESIEELDKATPPTLNPEKWSILMDLRDRVKDHSGWAELADKRGDWINIGLAIAWETYGQDKAKVNSTAYKKGLSLWRDLSAGTATYLDNEERAIAELKKDWASFAGRKPKEGGASGLAAILGKAWKAKVDVDDLLGRAKAAGVEITFGPASVEDFTDDDPDDEPGKTADAPEPEAKPMGRRLSLKDIMSEEPAEFIVQGLLQRGQILTVTGDPKAGKTFYTMHAAKAIALGEPVFGRKTCPAGEKPKVVLYLAYESETSIKARVRAWNAAGIKIPEDNLILVGNLRARLSPKGGLEQLIKELGNPHFDVLVVDTMIKASAGSDLNDLAQVSGIMAYLRKLTSERYCATIVVHHGRKGSDINNVGGSMYGSVAFGADIDGVVYVSYDEVTRDHIATRTVNRDGGRGQEDRFRVRGISTMTRDNFGDLEESAYLVEVVPGVTKVDDPNFGVPALPEDVADLKARLVEAIRHGPRCNFETDASGWRKVTKEWGLKHHRKDFAVQVDPKAEKARENRAYRRLAAARDLLHLEHLDGVAEITLEFETYERGTQVKTVTLHRRRGNGG